MHLMLTEKINGFQRLNSIDMTCAWFFLCCRLSRFLGFSCLYQRLCIANITSLLLFHIVGFLVDGSSYFLNSATHFFLFLS